jgi:hypothetical protein
MNRMPTSRITRRTLLSGTAAVAALLAAHPFIRAQDATPVAGEDPLSAWNDGPPKQAIEAFIASVTDPGNPGYVPPYDRLAVFDLDGTLWVERPAYVDLLFAEDRARDLIEMDPALAAATPYADLVALDEGRRASLTHEDVLALVSQPFKGETPETYTALAVEWLNTAVNPHFDRRVVALTYLPMLQLMRHLEANGFAVAIASAGDIDFLRAHAEPVFGVPPERVIGSMAGLEVADEQAGKVALRRTGETGFEVWGDGKAIAIERHMGQRPIFAVGNADGDLQMLGYTLAAEGERLAMMVVHDDGEREFEYGADTNLKTPVADLESRGIVVISMKNDFREIFAPGDGPDLLAGD